MEASESTGVSSNLTSTVESLLTNNGHEKKISHNDSISVGDSTPSSSSDANMQTSVVKTIQDDPISSTSDALTHETEINLTTLTSDINFIVSVEGSGGSTTELGTDSDFFTSELNIASMSSEKISEDVEDIANDLENLLGETTSSYDVICSNSGTIREIKDVEKKINILAVEHFADQDIHMSVKSDIHNTNEQLETHNKTEIDTVEFTEGISVKSDISELNDKTDILSNEDNATCIKADEVKQNVGSHVSNTEGMCKDSILQGDFIENEENNEKTNSAFDGNIKCHEIISPMDSDVITNSKEGLKLLLEEEVESNNDQNRQLQDVSQGEHLQEMKIGILNEVVEEKVCITPTNDSKLEMETISDVIVVQETKPTNELHEIGFQCTDLEKVSSSSAELKENLSEIGEAVVAETSEKVCMLSVQDVVENTSLISESDYTHSPTIATIKDDGNIISGSNTDTVDNTQLQLVQQGQNLIENIDEIATQVSIQSVCERGNNIGNDENQEQISNVENALDTSKNMAVGNTITDTTEPANSKVDIDVEKTFCFIEDNAVQQLSSPENPQTIIDKKESNQDEILQQDMSLKNINHEDKLEKDEIIDSSNQSEANIEDLLPCSIPPNVKQNEDTMNTMELSENIENKEYLQQEDVNDIDQVIETTSEMNTESNFVLPSDTTDQPEDFVHLELKHIESQDNQSIQNSSDEVTPTDIDKTKDDKSDKEVCFDVKINQHETDQLERANEVSVIDEVASDDISHIDAKEVTSGEEKSFDGKDNQCQTVQFDMTNEVIAEVSSDDVIPTDTNEEKGEKSGKEEYFDVKDDESDTHKCEKINEGSIIAGEPSIVVDEKVSLASNINDSKISKDDIEMAVDKSNILNYLELPEVSDTSLETSALDAASLIHTSNKQNPMLDAEMESETQTLTLQEDMMNTTEMTTSIKVSEVEHANNIESVQSNDKSLLNFSRNTEMSSGQGNENLKNTEKRIDDVESDSSNLNTLEDCKKLVELERTNVCEIQYECMKENIPEILQDTSQSNLAEVDELVQKLDHDETNDVQEISQEASQGNLVSANELHGDQVGLEQSNDIQEVVIEQVSKYDENKRDKVDQEQSSDTQEDGLEEVNVKYDENESQTADQDESNNIQEVIMEQVSLKYDENESGKVYEEQSKDLQEVGMAHESVKYDENEGDTVDQEQANDIQEVTMQQVSVEYDENKGDTVDQEQANDIQEVAVEQVSVEYDENKGDTVDQEQANDIQEVAVEQVIVEYAENKGDTVDQEQANDIQEVAVEQVSVEYAENKGDTVDQEQANDIQEVAVEQVSVEYDENMGDTLEQDHAIDIQEAGMEQVTTKYKQNEGDIVIQGQPEDIQEVTMEQVSVKSDECEGVSLEAIQLEKRTQEILQEESNTCRSGTLIAKPSENENLEQADIVPNIEQASVDVKQLVFIVHSQVEQSANTTLQQISTEDKISSPENNMQQSNNADLLNDKMDTKSDNIEDNANEKDQVKDDLKNYQNSPSEEPICEEQNMEEVVQVESRHIELAESSEIAHAKCTQESDENASKIQTATSESSLQLPLDGGIVSSEHIIDQNESEEFTTKQNDHDLLQMHQFEEDSDMDKNPSEIANEISQNIENSQAIDDLNETSELQNAISHIIETSETIDHSNVSILQDASMADIVDTSHETDHVKSSELDNANSDIFYSPDSTDIKTSEVENAISQIIEASSIVHTLDNTSELQSAISHIIDEPESVIDCGKTSELQNAISQIIDSSVVQEDSNDKISESDVLKNAIDNMHSSNQEINVESNNIILEQIDITTREDVEQKSEDTEIIEEKTTLEDNDRKDPEGIMQSIYTEPVVDLMLEDMDNQLKIFQSKSDTTIANIANISEVDTPKAFESQHIDLILPEETSLLNTDDIISEITPRNEDIVEFVREVDIKLQKDHASGNELKIEEIHANESKDLNDVIAREIESLLEHVSDVPAKIENPMDDFVLEERIPIASVSESGERTFDDSSMDANKVVMDVLQDNVLDQSTQEEIDKSQPKIFMDEHNIEVEAKWGTVINKGDSEEVSSSSVINADASVNLDTDSLITSTQCIESQSTKELDTPLVIEVGTSIITAEEKESGFQSETIVIPTSEYSSKMSENQDLKMTITKHKIDSSVKVSDSLEVDDTSSILKIYDPKDIVEAKKTQKSKEVIVPKLIIKPIVRALSSPPPTTKHFEEEQTVPKLYIKNMSPNRPGSPKVMKAQKSEITSPLKLTIKPVLKPEESQSKSSPKLTIKPIIKTDEESSASGPKITIKPIVKPPEEEMCHSPKITIKPIIKPDDCQSDMIHSPRITIKPIPKPEDVKEFGVLDAQGPRITIRPVMKPEEEIILKKPSDIEHADRSHSPRITIKPVVKPEEHKLSSKQDQKLKQDDAAKADKKEGSPKITIKPIVKPVDSESDSVELIDFEDQIKQERIVLKINKNSMTKDSRKRDSTEEIEKLAKIKLKFSKEGGRAQIVSEQSKLKRALEESLDYDQKRTKFESDDLTITPIDADAKKTEKVVDIIKDDVNITPIEPNPRSIFDDPLEKIPVFEITPESAVMMKSTTGPIVQQVTAPAPRKRGRPRKVPLVVREEFKDAKEEEVQPEQQPQPAPEDTGRPKRSCRGPSVRTTLGIRTRKPRGSGRGRGRGRGARGVGSRGGRQQRVSAAKLKLLQEEAAAAIAEQSKSLELEDGGDVEMKEEPSVENVTTETSEIVLIEEETRMSADINTSRAQTPAKQIPTPGDVDDTQSSVQSTATTESTKGGRKGTRLEIHHEPEGEIISADQLTEYYWGGGGPFMLQEQVAQFLGIKSFKRKYPGIQRRTVDMQERDFIRESGLASEAMCDLGLTAVHSADILDIMYSDFQNKYEEYCKHQRDRQAKDFTNKQKALSLAASQEKNKQDIMQSAVQSAASWNANFNKSRREERKACMDLQTFTVHYPKGRFKTIERNKIGHYPVALVPGQYTDYYKNFTSNELSNLPLNTMLDRPLNIPVEEDSQSDGSGSDSDSSTSDSDSSSSDSTDEDCNICSPASSNQSKKVLAN